MGCQMFVWNNYIGYDSILNVLEYALHIWLFFAGEYPFTAKA